MDFQIFAGNVNKSEKLRWPPLKHLGSKKKKKKIQGGNLENIRYHPQNHFSGCRLKA